ncbi:hypothetical protein FQN52_006058 [Onygenales sp. PD_12]|nr:hypothetical protein FQN52_006058 [Onygenales sp. PD_12]
MKSSLLLGALCSLSLACAQDQIVEPSLDVNKEPTTPGAKLVKTRSGPFKVDAMDMIENRPVLNIDQPCSDCYIVAIQAGLEYENGTVANSDTGGWLHHMVLAENGLLMFDPVCPVMPIKRIYASGNERSVARTNGVDKYGIHVEGRLGMLVDLMNMSDQDQEYYVTMTYEFISGEAAAGYKPVTVAWLDVTGNCPISYVPAKEGSYELKSRGWRSTISGRLLFAYGHEHSGGTNTTIYLNGEPVCVSQMQYGMVGMSGGEGGEGGDGHGGHEGHDGGDGGDMGGMPKMNMTRRNTRRQMDMPESLIGATRCVDFGELKRGDELVIGAGYDTSKHPLDQEMDGSRPMPVMGISRVYIGGT